MEEVRGSIPLRSTRIDIHEPFGARFVLRIAASALRLHKLLPFAGAGGILAGSSTVTPGYPISDPRSVMLKGIAEPADVVTVK